MPTAACAAHLGCVLQPTAPDRQPGQPVTVQNGAGRDQAQESDASSTRSARDPREAAAASRQEARTAKR